MQAVLCSQAPCVVANDLERFHVRELSDCMLGIDSDTMDFS